MHHLAIMKKSWGLLPKIISGEKTIESRWYKNKHSPWDKIKKGDVVYFKNSGEPVTAKAEVSDVLQFADLDPGRIREILDKYGKEDGLRAEDIGRYFGIFKDKKYCLLVFLVLAQEIEPFEVDKTGFGSMSAWIAVDDIGKIKI